MRGSSTEIGPVPSLIGVIVGMAWLFVIRLVVKFNVDSLELLLPQNILIRVVAILASVFLWGVLSIGAPVLLVGAFTCERFEAETPDQSRAVSVFCAALGISLVCFSYGEANRAWWPVAFCFVILAFTSSELFISYNDEGTTSNVVAGLMFSVLLCGVFPIYSTAFAFFFYPTFGWWFLAGCSAATILHALALQHRWHDVRWIFRKGTEDATLLRCWIAPPFGVIATAATLSLASSGSLLACSAAAISSLLVLKMTLAEADLASESSLAVILKAILDTISIVVVVSLFYCVVSLFIRFGLIGAVSYEQLQHIDCRILWLRDKVKTVTLGYVALGVAAVCLIVRLALSRLDEPAPWDGRIDAIWKRSRVGLKWVKRLQDTFAVLAIFTLLGSLTGSPRRQIEVRLRDMKAGYNEFMTATERKVDVDTIAEVYRQVGLAVPRPVLDELIAEEKVAARYEASASNYDKVTELAAQAGVGPEGRQRPLGSELQSGQSIIDVLDNIQSDNSQAPDEAMPPQFRVEDAARLKAIKEEFAQATEEASVPAWMNDALGQEVAKRIFRLGSKAARDHLSKTFILAFSAQLPLAGKLLDTIWSGIDEVAANKLAAKAMQIAKAVPSSGVSRASSVSTVAPVSKKFVTWTVKSIDKWRTDHSDELRDQREHVELTAKRQDDEAAAVSALAVAKLDAETNLLSAILKKSGNSVNSQADIINSTALNSANGGSVSLTRLSAALEKRANRIREARMLAEEHPEMGEQLHSVEPTIPEKIISPKTPGMQIRVSEPEKPAEYAP